MDEAVEQQLDLSVVPPIAYAGAGKPWDELRFGDELITEAEDIAEAKQQYKALWESAQQKAA